jgi:hypothetical protein
MNKNIFKCQVKTTAQCKQNNNNNKHSILQLITVKLEGRTHTNVQYNEIITITIRNNKCIQVVKYNLIFYAKITFS